MSASTLPPYDPWLTGTVAFEVGLATQARGRALAARAAQRLVSLLEAASRRSPLVRRILDGREPSSMRLEALPAMRKADLMAAFEDWVGDPEVERSHLRRFLADPTRIADPYVGRYVAWESSGSSGEPAMFLQDARALAVYDALEALRRPSWSGARQWLDPWGVTDTTVFVGATDGHFASNVSIERLRRLNPLVRDRVHALSFLQPLEQLCRALEMRRPTVIATYPTQAVLLAEEREAGRLKIAPREIWTGGETLTPAMRRVVEQAFSCTVVNSYGASEFLTIASDCPRGRLHLNSDWVILEPVDEKGRGVEPGMTGSTTLLTNLANHAQPLIRYDIGDRVTFATERCECGSHLPVIDVEGRCDDILRLPGTHGRRVSVSPLALGTVLEEEAGLFDFQVLQCAADRLELRSGLRGPAAEHTLRHARAVLASFIARQGARGVHVECHAGEPVSVGRSGKIPRVVIRTPGAHGRG